MFLSCLYVYIYTYILPNTQNPEIGYKTQKSVTKPRNRLQNPEIGYKTQKSVTKKIHSLFAHSSLDGQ
jgi:hypothetical protein